MRILDVDEAAPADIAGVARFLVEGERVEAGFVSPTGMILFTDRRILLSQREHLLEEKVETSSFPYREMRHVSLMEGQSAESRGVLKIWLAGEPQPLHLRADRGALFLSLQRLLAGKLG
jgi:PH (Pleckstrin Homology) domain-containing protein